MTVEAEINHAEKASQDKSNEAYWREKESHLRKEKTQLLDRELLNKGELEGNLQSISSGLPRHHIKARPSALRDMHACTIPLLRC